MNHDAKIVFLDIEVLPNVLTSWSLRSPEYIGHENIIEERTILTASWKYLGADKVHSADVISTPPKRGQAPDYEICARLHSVFSSADAIVAHNGDSFDVPWVKTRLIALGFPPPPPVKTIDTKKLAKAHFYFNSNRLDYLGKYLGLGQKIKTDFDLWLRCIRPTSEADRRKAVAEMVRYNKQDVRLLELVYERLKPYVPARLNLNLVSATDMACPTCGESNLQQRGFATTTASRFIRYQCQACGAWSRRPAGSAVVR